MVASNLFSRIEGYEGENFTTEILAHILKTDPKVRDAFLKLLLKRQPTLPKVLRSCAIETQPRYAFGQPDIEIRSTGDRHNKVFVEIKTQSQEGKLQIQKYLKFGYVAYLTPLGYDAPDLDGADAEKLAPRYLGQFFWPDVYSAIQRASSHNILHEQFLKYLEARHMGPLPPISEDDLRASLHAADAIRKFQELVEDVRKKIEPDWADEFGKNVGGRNVALGVGTGNLPYWWFRADDPLWAKPNRRLCLSIGVYAKEGVHDRPCFYVELYTEQKEFGWELEADQRLRALCKDVGWRWDAAGIPDWWGYYKSFPVRTGNIDAIAQEQIGNIRAAKKEITKLVKFVKKRLKHD